jgi:hypothetical protein
MNVCINLFIHDKAPKDTDINFKNVYLELNLGRGVGVV